MPTRITGTVRHTHQYFQRKDGLWACSGIENCSHYMPKNMLPAPLGRMSLCWTCEKEFRLTPMNMQDTHPVCDTCKENQDNVSKFIDMMMPDDKVTKSYTQRMQEKAERKQKEINEIEVIDEDGNVK